MFVNNKQNEKSNWILCSLMLLSPVLFHMIGLAYAGYLHDQGQAFGSAYLALLLLFNSFLMLVVNIIITINNKRRTKNS